VNLDHIYKFIVEHVIFYVHIHREPEK